MAVTLEDIKAAAKTIEGVVVRTPTTLSRTLSDICGCEIWIKFENFQYTASFKERGALVKLTSLGAESRKKGVIAVSAGNHAQAVACHAQRLQIPATIVMPEGTPFTKIRHTENFGARVVVAGADLSAAEDTALRLQKEEGLTFIHPYDDPAIIAGQGTIAAEMFEDAPSLDALVVPVGGGGLISGIATAARGLRPDIEVFGVEARRYPAMSEVLRGARGAAGGATIAEGIAVKRPGELTRKIIRDTVERIFLVDEAAIEEAVQMFIEIEKTVAEGAGAVPLAAVRANPEQFAGRRVGLVLSGGNIDSRLLSAILMRGLVRNGQLVRIRIDMKDSPGMLGRVAQTIGAAGGNIVEVYHQRLFNNVPLKMAELDVIVETRDSRHANEILAKLRDAGVDALQLSSATGEEIV